MLLSKRRLRWATVALLMASGLLLNQPTRAWLQHMWIAGALGPQVTVGEVIYHKQNSIVEVRNLRWQGNRAADAQADSSAKPPINFSVNAVRCWLGIDRTSLVDGRIHIPKFVVQDAVVTLTSSFPQPNANLDEWRHGMASHLEQLDWNHVERRVSSLSATEAIEMAWSQRAQGVVERSRDILAESGRIEREAAAMDNPLRFEESIRARLTRYRELSVEQRSLLGQLADMQNDLAGEFERLQELLAQDVRALEQVCAQLKATDGSGRQALALDSQLALTIAEASWAQVAPYGEIVAGTSQAAAGLRAADYDITVRPGALGKEHIHCADLKASGEFRFGQFSTPFQTSGSWRLAQRSPGDVFRELNFLTTFDCPNNTLEVAAAHDSRKSTAIQLRIRMLSQDLAKRADLDAPASATTLHALAPVTANLTSDSGSLTGTLRIASEALPHLSHRLPHDLLVSLQESLSDNADESPHEPLQFELSGTWQWPEMKLSGPAPAWLQRAVEQMLEQQSQQLIAASHQKLETEFTRCIEKMREQVALTARDALAIVARDESTLLTSQQRLQQRFDEMSGTEFARRAGEVQR